MLLMVFKVIQLIGFGDYGHVYRASHRNLVNSMQTGFLQERRWCKSDLTLAKKLSLFPYP